MAVAFCAYTGLLNAVASLAFVIFIALKKQKTLLDKRFAFFAFSVGYWGLSYFFWLSARQADSALFFIRNAMAGAIFIPSTFMHLVLSLIEASWRSRKIVIVGNYLLSVVFLIFCFSPLYIVEVEPRLFFPFWPVPGMLFHFVLLHFSVNIILAHFLMWQAIKRTSGLKQNQIKYVFIGTLIGFIGGCTNYLLWYALPVPPFLNFLVAIYIATLAYAIIKFRLMDVNVAMTRTTIFVLLYAVIIGVPLGTIAWGKIWLTDRWGSKWWYIPLGFYAVLSAIGPFIYLILQRKAEAVVLKEQKAYQQTLLQASKGMTLIKNLDHLLKLIVHILTKTVRITHTRIFLWDNNAKNYVCKAVRGDCRKGLGEVISENAAFIRQLHKTKEPLMFEEVRSHNSADETVIDEIEALQAALVIPSFVQERLIGFVVLGNKKSNRLYTESDLDILTTLANQAALAIENCIFLTEFEHQQAHFFQAAKMADLGTMASGIGHQVNNRFNVIKLGAESALMMELKRLPKCFEENDPETGMKMIQGLTDTCRKIAKNAEHGGEIVRRLLDFSRLAQGFRIMDVREAIESSVRLWECKHDLREIGFNMDIDGNLMKINGNFSEIEEILFNLLDNAADAVRMKEEACRLGNLSRPEREERGTIWLKAENSELNGNPHVLVSVRENGIGMDEETQKRIFVPFFTMKATAVKGTGLGLYIIRKMVDAHQGRIQIDSEYGKGTTFSIYLPAVAGG
ncbi:MAG: Sensor protein ZraS [Candidatus Omnitrophica bacterium ADurb.Bin277]|nr:MAG: Sensor protein ZraS [Candidatus Omnitrophica bacterium ADurb.Bin277]